MKFQFTRPRGARRDIDRGRRAVRVSIHAPTGGATPDDTTASAQSVFQFTRPRGARQEKTAGAGGK